ncbi:MAG: cytochrome C oxidase Cbb3 [Gammaproteobacteria bacterium]|nr:cytochrome C oxidase Cbb3 [Gammaproteobacteria bacterium]NIR98584.1 cytochrome C oxidase Cbb3 [Gammaproteobacteria bacterium]NIT64307.1 cytochrome C oxidase Cbb3 [Gammaproteobacteria bacterium]NIV21231.1 cytochrome C oxidase Cbb3 [Gammaproteobacteria bacterium]NIX10935.1 cytochrome C oxidase Cbb3 [Gammaproteobacteria bacterium]
MRPRRSVGAKAQGPYGLPGIARRAAGACALWGLALSAAAAPDAAETYGQHCARCHGEARLGGMGPALLPGNLKRLRREKAAQVIARGRPATQMPAFGDRLSEGQIQALVDYVYAPLPDVPQWGAEAIGDSRIVHNALASLGGRPVHEADPLNLFVVVELGDHHATVLDGDRLEPIHRFRTRYALHGGPKYSPDGRFVYLASRDGWISKYDLYNLKLVAEVRAGINTRNLAVSGDGRYVMVANYLPHTLALLDARELEPIKIFPVDDGKGNSSRVSAVYAAPPRESFIAALKDIPEVWEISYSDNPEPVYQGLVHDYRHGEGLAEEGLFPVRRIRLDDYLDDFFFDQSYRHLLGAARNDKNGQIVNLIVGRKIAKLQLDGLPHLGSGITWDYQGRRVMATPNLKKGEVSVIDMQTWKTVERIPTLGPGFFMRSHENTPYAWVDVFFGPDRDAVHVIDKRTLEIVKTLRPAPGKTAAHVEFDRYGKYALVSIWDMNGAVVVYDADTLEEIKRLPMVKPSGKYNVYNKIHRSEGTSH